MRFNAAFTKTVQILFAYLLLLFTFQVFRVLPLFLFRGENNPEASVSDLLLAFWTGFKFDTIIITYLFAVLLLFLIPLIITSSKKYVSFISRFYKIYFITISFLVLILVTIDYYYYRFFHSHLDAMAFGIVEDDTKAVLVSVWTDYPVIRLLIGFTLSFLIIRWFYRKIMVKEYQFFSGNFIVRTVYVILFLGVFLLGMRGSLGTFPIGKDNMVICNNNVINDITPNGVFYLKETITDRMRYQIDTTIAPILSKYKYHNPKSAVQEYIIKKVESGKLMESLEQITDTNSFLEKNPPNVVFIVMESFGNHYFDLHSESLNLLGELEEQLNYCYIFRNFLSSCNGTIPSLESLVVNTPSTPISQSKYKTVSLKSSCALPFKEQGYNTTYITGGDLAWRNTGNYISRQYFDEVEGRGEVLKTVKGSSDCTWGVYDQFLFERIYDKLTENNSTGKSSFIFALTTTNHTPFERPKSYKPHPVELTQEIIEATKTTEEITVDNFTSYQYSSHYLGELINKIRNSEFGDNTIIAITGDHSNKQLFEYADDMAYYKLTVPFILYVPEAYMQQKVVDTARFGSHKDIFPTLYSLALSEQKYLNSGNDLLSPDTSIHFYGVNEYKLGMDKQGVIYSSSGLAYEWIGNSKKLKVANEKTKFQPLNKAIRSYSFSMDFYVRSMLRDSFLKKEPE